MKQDAESGNGCGEGRTLLRDGIPCARTGLKYGDVERLLSENPNSVGRECRIAYRASWNQHPYKPYSVFLCYFPQTTHPTPSALIVPVLDFCNDNGQPIERIVVDGQVMLKNADGSFGKFSPTSNDERAADWVVETIRQAWAGDESVPADDNKTTGR